MKVALGIPTVGDVVPAFKEILGAAVEIGREGEIVIIVPVDEFPVDRAREFVVGAAIGNECDLLMFIDSDTKPPKGFWAILREVMERTKAQVVAGMYLQRGYPYANIWARVENGKAFHLCAGGEGEVEIHACGMGCTLIDLTWVRKNLERPFFRIIHGEGSKDYALWEDFYFCKKVIEHGGKVLGVPRVFCGHMAPRQEVTKEFAQFSRKAYIEAEMAKRLEEGEEM